jgi:hypothetical protein
MPVLHRFLQSNFGNGFETNNAVLKTPYGPEVMFIGTFNPDIPTNPADFFYGRNYFWPAFKNLSNNNIQLSRRRMPTRGAAPAILNPTLPEVFQLCMRFSLTFSDLIQETLLDVDDVQDMQLNILVGNGNAIMNDGEIARYIIATPSIKRVYFTRKFGNDINHIWAHWLALQQQVQHARPNEVAFGSVVTPSGQGITNVIPTRMATILRYWTWANHPNYLHAAAYPLHQQNGYIHLDHGWLADKGVDVHAF